MGVVPAGSPRRPPVGLEPQPIVTRLTGEERRRRLIAEAMEAFGRRGYEGTTLDQVAEAAGVRKQTLLYYFPTKEDLFDTCIEALAAGLAEAFQRGLEGSPEGWARVEAVIRSIFRLGEQRPELLPFAREGARRSPEVVHRVAGRLEPLRKRALAFLERGMEEGEFRRQDPGLLLFTLYTAVVGSLTEAGVLRAVAGGASGRTALQRREQELIEFVRRALEP